LWLSAPTDWIESRRFDFVGATLIALSLAALTWSLGQIGHSVPRAATRAVGTNIGALAVGVLGLAGPGAYVAWERVSTHPMIPPRLAQNRAFVGLNAATLLIYAGLAIMFFLLPFELEAPWPVAVFGRIGFPAVLARGWLAFSVLWRPR
jgi:hypothetical protein